MRPILSSLLLLASVPLVAIAGPVHLAGSPPVTPHSAANVVRWHPAPWSMPAPGRTAMRFDPETGEAVVIPSPGSGDASLRTTDQAEARRLAAANVQWRADGSQHVVVGAAFRSWTVATIDEQGRLTQDCVSSQAEAQARVDAAAKKQVRK